ncbi:MAG: membrane integrity-associated transporter subunit PqiC [Thioalkalivibrio sp.]|nr:membrane integrity-associated transporter subunit PqiC [Thioalkalivibrio sp.]
MRLLSGSLGMAILLLTTACGIGPGRTEAPTVHMLEWSGAGHNAAEGLGVTIRVNPPAAYPGYQSARMAYRQERHTLRYFAYNRWADAPARLVGAALTEALSGTGLFQDVVPPGSRIDAAYRLDTDLVRLEQRFDADGSEIHLGIRYRLVGQASRRSLGSLQHDITVPSATDDPRGGVIAANRAMRESFEDLFDVLPNWIDASR